MKIFVKISQVILLPWSFHQVQVYHLEVMILHSCEVLPFSYLSAPENYSGNPFLPSDSDLLLESPDHDDIVEYFADAIDGPSQSDEEKP